MPRSARSALVSLINRDVDFSDNDFKFKLLYLMPNPYRLGSSGEKFRFFAVNRFLRANIGEIGSILELGSGEGHQTQEFEKIARRVTGIELSQAAVRRAQARCPKSVFHCGSHLDIPGLTPGGFTLATACEVLYYISNIENCLRILESQAQNVLVSYYYVSKYYSILDPIIDRKNLIASEIIEVGDSRWRIALWKGTST